MSLAGAIRALERAESTTFKDAYKDFSKDRDGELPTLSDESIALVRHVAEKRLSDTNKIKEELPEEFQTLFDECLKMSTQGGAFFKGFSLFLRPPIDGMLVGFGNDDMYYVLLVWDFNGSQQWKPTQALYGDPVL